MTIEVVITVWENGLFKMRDKVEASDLVKLNSQLEFVIENIRIKLEEEQKHKYDIGVDDDIPF